MQYQVSVRPFGEAMGNCASRTDTWESLEPALLSIFPSGRVQCSARLTDYDFNFEALRYLRVYPLGFVDGVDEAGNTPFIEIGTCSRID
ncbi:MAG: hypothetical protein E5X63_32465 [Mesorhizobium sp.]|nr:MAG: hypothetical protein E5X63_32465 [Mesorhizobium sp.]